MKKLLIIEDELLIAAMTEMAAKSFGFEVVAKAKNLQQAFLCIQEDNFDIAAVDINLGTGLEGLEVGKILHKKGIPFFYLTSYESGEIIRQASETSPGTYLIKPFNPAQLLAALEVSLQNSRPSKKKNVTLENGTSRFQLDLDEILYVESDKVYIDIRTHNKVITLRMSLKSFRDLVPDNQFLQTHRSYLVNVVNISKFSNNDITLGSFTIPIARSFKEQVLDQLKNKTTF